MSEIQTINKSDYANFSDRLQRWHRIVFDEKTESEFAMVLSRSFVKEDFDYCEKTLMEDDQKKYSLSPSDLYKICLKSKKEREKRERLRIEVKNSETLTFNKAGRAEVEKAIKDLNKALKNKRKVKDCENSLKAVLYEYVNLENGKISKVIAKGDLNESEFKKACREKFYSKPHTIKKIYHKMITKEQLDKNGNAISKYTTLQPVSSMSEGSVLYTVGYF